MPMLWTLHGPNLSGGFLRRGVPGFLHGILPLPAIYLRIFGVTKDSAGTALASCTVDLFQTLDDKFIETQTSDASGNYEFRSPSLSTAYYVVAYKAGAPDVAGTTLNTLIGG